MKLVQKLAQWFNYSKSNRSAQRGRQSKRGASNETIQTNIQSFVIPLGGTISLDYTDLLVYLLVREIRDDVNRLQGEKYL